MLMEPVPARAAMVSSIVSRSICRCSRAAPCAPSAGINLVLACPATGALAMIPTRRRGLPVGPSRSLPDDKARFRLSDAHGAGNSGGNSITERLEVRTLHESDQVKAASYRMDPRDHRIVQLHAAQLSHKLLDPAGFGR